MTDAWEPVDSEVEYRNPHFVVERESIRLPNGELNEYYRIDSNREGVIAIGVVEGSVLFVELYRPRLNVTIQELPGGGIDHGETPEEAARREFAEETGYKPSTAQPLGAYYYTARSQSKRHFVWVDDFEQTQNQSTETEIQSVVRVPVEEVLEVACTPPAAEWNTTALLLANREGLISLA